MRTLLTSLLLLLLTTYIQAQSYVVFTSIDNNEETRFWKINVELPFVYYSISDKLDSIAPYQGQDVGPITVSRDGHWYTFLSSRFDAGAQGWEALTVVDSDFSYYEVVRDQSGNLIHSEGKASMLSDGSAVVFVADIGNHNRDVFVMYRLENGWGNPVNITQNSPYDYNYCPYVSDLGNSVLFDAGNTPFPSTAIGEVDINGTNIGFPVSAMSLPNGIATHSPCYNSNGDIIFEGDDGNERVWKLPAGDTVPVIINPALGNDNSPTTITIGEIASLWIPNDKHQIKIMSDDGSGYNLITDSSALFTEVFDIGISSYSTPTSVTNQNSTNYDFTIYPNPTSGYLNIGSVNYRQIKTVSIFTISGKLIEIIESLQSGNIDFTEKPDGLYFIIIDSEEGTYLKKIIKY